MGNLLYMGVYSICKHTHRYDVYSNPRKKIETRNPTEMVTFYLFDLDGGCYIHTYLYRWGKSVRNDEVLAGNSEVSFDLMWPYTYNNCMYLKTSWMALRNIVICYTLLHIYIYMLCNIYIYIYLHLYITYRHIDLFMIDRFVCYIVLHVYIICDCIYIFVYLLVYSFIRVFLYLLYFMFFVYFIYLFMCSCIHTQPYKVALQR